MATTNTSGATRTGFGMVLIAFLSFNVAIAALFGSFSVLLASAGERMHVGLAVGSLGVPLSMIAVALLAPIAGILSGRMSLRLLMMSGSLMGAVGFAILAFTSNIVVFLLVYALLIGPAFCLCAVVLPPTLVTRWITGARGRALGLVNFPIGTALMPTAALFVLHSYGLSAVYLALSGLMILNLLAQAFVVDNPPRAAAETAGEGAAADAEPEDSGPTTGEILRHRSLWVLTIANASLIAATIMLTAHIVPLAISMGNDTARGATLYTLMSVGGFVGPLLCGWMADKIGGRKTMIILCVDSAVLWAVLLTSPPFPVLAGVIMLFGLHSSGSIAAYAISLSEVFGKAGFARAFGLGNLVNLPFTVAAVPLAGIIFDRTHSFSGAVLFHTVFFAVAALLAIFFGTKAVHKVSGVSAH